MSKRIVILYSELAEYTVACLRALAATDVQLLLVHWPVNPEAPFQLDLRFCEQSVSRDSVNPTQLQQLVDDFKPDLILCSGWIDNDYLTICKRWRQSIPTVLTLDNHWTGSLKQRLAVMLAPFTIRRSFSNAFVPGEVQKRYALKLGFSDASIRTGFYSADVPRFNAVFDRCHPNKKQSFPKRFLYLGRYVEHKGIFDLWEAFIQLRKEFPDWELWCCGTGDAYEDRVEAEGIRHFGFVQPADFQPILESTGVYVLTSHFEPWGVSVHEMAAAGFPMILSTKVGAKEAFLKTGKNGFEYPSGDVNALLKAMREIASLEPNELIGHAELSHDLAQNNTPMHWAEKVLSFL